MSLLRPHPLKTFVMTSGDVFNCSSVSQSMSPTAKAGTD